MNAIHEDVKRALKASQALSNSINEAKDEFRANQFQLEQLNRKTDSAISLSEIISSESKGLNKQISVLKDQNKNDNNSILKKLAELETGNKTLLWLNNGSLLIIMALFGFIFWGRKDALHNMLAEAKRLSGENSEIMQKTNEFENIKQSLRELIVQSQKEERIKKAEEETIRELSRVKQLKSDADKALIEAKTIKALANDESKEAAELALQAQMNIEKAEKLKEKVKKKINRLKKKADSKIKKKK